MARTLTCANCGKDVLVLCSACWRCEDCEKDCPVHMKRVIDGIIGKNLHKVVSS